MKSKISLYIFSFLFLLFSNKVLSQEPEEVTLAFILNNEFIGDISCLYSETEESFYIDINNFMSYLGYSYDFDENKQSFSSCCPDSSNCFSIQNKNLSYKEKQNIPEKILWYENKPYLQSDLLSEITLFPIKTILNSLTLNIVSKNDVPALKKLLIKRKRDKLLLEQNEKLQEKIDFIPPKNLHINSIGYYLNNQLKINDKNSFSGRITTNGELLKGAFNINYYALPSNMNLRDNLTFEWNRVFNKTKWVKQLSIYRNYSSTIKSLSGYTTAFLLSNQNLTNSFYKITSYYTGKTTPNTELEIYNNNLFIGIAKSDSLGVYHMAVPINYGTNNINSIFYDKYGSLFTKTQNLYLSFNLLPEKKFVYNFFSGITDSNNFFSHLKSEYGLNKNITLSAGAEYLIDNKSINWTQIVGVRSSFSDNFTFNANYIPNFKWNLNGSNFISKYLSINYSYEKYLDTKNENTLFNPSNKFSASLTTQIPNKLIKNTFRFSLDNIKYPLYNTFYGNMGIYFSYGKFSNNINIRSYSEKNIQLNNLSYGVGINYSFKPGIYALIYGEYESSLNNIRLINRIQYNINNKIQSYIENNWNPNSNNFSISLGLSWRLSKVQAESNFYYTNNNNPYFNLSLSGSAVFQGNNKITLSSRFATGGNILIIPFLDVNADNEYNDNEEILKYINIITPFSSQIIRSNKGISFTDITPNYAFKLIIPNQSLRDISWSIKSLETSLILQQYQTKTIYVPINIISEISGRIMLNNKKLKSSIDNIRLILKNIDNQKVYMSKTDEDGEYYIEKLTCGKYSLSISQSSLDNKQLKLLNESDLEKIIVIPCGKEGQEISNANFILTNL